MSYIFIKNTEGEPTLDSYECDYCRKQTENSALPPDWETENHRFMVPLNREHYCPKCADKLANEKEDIDRHRE